MTWQVLFSLCRKIFYLGVPPLPSPPLPSPFLPSPLLPSLPSPPLFHSCTHFTRFSYLLRVRVRTSHWDSNLKFNTHRSLEEEKLLKTKKAEQDAILQIHTCAIPNIRRDISYITDLELAIDRSCIPALREYRTASLAELAKLLPLSNDLYCKFLEFIKDKQKYWDIRAAVWRKKQVEIASALALVGPRRCPLSTAVRHALAQEVSIYFKFILHIQIYLY